MLLLKIFLMIVTIVLLIGSILKLYEYRTNEYIETTILLTLYLVYLIFS